MISRAAGAIASTVSAAVAAAATDHGAKMATVPTVWAPLGYPFEAGSMIAALCACIAVRFYVGLSSAQHRWQLDVPVSALAVMFTVAAVIRLRPDPLLAIAYGTGFGILGAGIIAIAKNKVDQMLRALGIEPDPSSTGKDPT